MAHEAIEPQISPAAGPTPHAHMEPHAHGPPPTQEPHTTRGLGHVLGSAGEGGSLLGPGARSSYMAATLGDLLEPQSSHVSVDGPSGGVLEVA